MKCPGSVPVLLALSFFLTPFFTRLALRAEEAPASEEELWKKDVVPTLQSSAQELYDKVFVLCRALELEEKASTEKGDKTLQGYRTFHRQCSQQALQKIGTMFGIAKPSEKTGSAIAEVEKTYQQPATPPPTETPAAKSPEATPEEKTVSETKTPAQVGIRIAEVVPPAVEVETKTGVPEEKTAEAKSEKSDPAKDVKKGKTKKAPAPKIPVFLLPPATSLITSLCNEIDEIDKKIKSSATPLAKKHDELFKAAFAQRDKKAADLEAALANRLDQLGNDLDHLSAMTSLCLGKKAKCTLSSDLRVQNFQILLAAARTYRQKNGRSPQNTLELVSCANNNNRGKPLNDMEKVELLLFAESIKIDFDALNEKGNSGVMWETELIDGQAIFVMGNGCINTVNDLAELKSMIQQIQQAEPEEKTETEE